MRSEILGWYAYSESGSAAAAAARPPPASFAGPGRMTVIEVDLSGAARTADLNDPAAVAGLFADARLLDAQIDAGGWQHLFSRYGLTGLIDLAKRRGGWPAATPDATVADAIVGESRHAGYEPERRSGKVESGEWGSDEIAG